VEVVPRAKRGSSSKKKAAPEDAPAPSPGAESAAPVTVPSGTADSSTSEAPIVPPPTGPPNPEPVASASGAPSLAPPTRESFDELAKKASKAQPRRGSIIQPPPAWEPDEVTLGFAMVNEPSGDTHELPEPTVLATILIAVENDRRAILNRFAGSFDEEIDAVASLFWPFLIVHSGPDPTAAAIFDGTGVWKRTFRYTLLPPMDGVQPLLDKSVAPAQYLAQMRGLTPHFNRDPGSEVLTVEGFLPLDPPLLFDVLSQSRFRSDPQAPHAGFLPARHEVGWYHDLVNQMRSWLDRFDGDIQRLTTIRTEVEKITEATRARLDADYRAADLASQERVQAALAQSQAEVAEAQKSHHAEVERHLEVIRRAQGTVARHETAIATTGQLAFRATHRRGDPAPHVARSRQSQNEIRSAHRQIAASRQAIEKVHEAQRAHHERTIAKVVDVEREGARALAEIELFRDDYLAVAAELMQTIDGQIAARSTQRNLLAGYFLPLPSLSSARVIWFPLWMATLRSSRGTRQIVFPPMQVRAGVGITGALRRLFGGIVLPLEPRTAQFDKVLRPTMEAALAHDPWLAAATAELTRAADVLVDPDVLARLQEGLAALRSEGWISEKQEQEFLRVYRERAVRRTGTAAPPTAGSPGGPPASPPPGVPAGVVPPS
jgi:hypothetical protein